MARYTYKYTRPKKNDWHYPDPTHSWFGGENLAILETPFGNDKAYICYIESDEAKINGVLNSHSEFNWQKFSNIDKATDWCNDNMEHEEGQEFTNDGFEIIDNRIYPDY